jgi:hypothetical protein
MRTIRRCPYGLATTLGLILGCLAAPAIRAQAPDEFRIKAAFLTKFAHFASWPADAVATGKEFRLCVLRPHRLGSWVQTLAADQHVEGRPVIVLEVTRTEDLDACHLLFLPGGANPAVLREAATRPILTVGEDTDFLDRGGIIRLRPVGNHLRFDINATQADRVGLGLSAQLLRLAESVRGGRP